MSRLDEPRCNGWGDIRCRCGGDLCVCGCDGELCGGCERCDANNVYGIHDEYEAADLIAAGKE